ncbi:MAG: hypothetical protein Q9225_000962 [Loekoesia sp. 1 TL-2023]
MYEKCPPGSTGVAVRDGACQCREQKLARLTARDDNLKGLHIGPAPASWQLQCVIYKICPPGYRGSVVKDGTCQCQPKKVGRGISFSDELHIKRDGLNPSSSPSPGAQLRCMFSKPCLPGYRGSIVNGQCVCKQKNKERDVAILEDFQVKRDTATLDEAQEQRRAYILNEIEKKRALIGGGSAAEIWRCLYQSNCHRGTIGMLVNGKCVCTKLTGVPPHVRLRRTGIEHPPLGHKAIETSDIETRTQPADPLKCGIGPKGCPHGQHHWVVDGLCTCIRYGEEDRRDLSISQESHEKQSERIGMKRQARQGSPQSHCPNLKCQPYQLVAYAYGQCFCKARLKERGIKRHITAEQCANQLCPAHERASLNAKGDCECLGVLQGRKRDRSIAAELQERPPGLASEKRVWHNAHPSNYPQLCSATKCPPHLYAFRGKDGLCHCIALKEARSTTVPEGYEDVQGEEVSKKRNTQRQPSPLTCAGTACPPRQRALRISGHFQCVRSLEKRRWSASCSGFQCPFSFNPTLNGGVCFCNKNPETNFPNPPSPPELKSPHNPENRGIDIQVHLTNSAADSFPPPQSNSDSISAQESNLTPQCPHASILHFNEVGESVQQMEKRQDPASCENFSCPAGFTPKLNGDVCYCGIDRHSPYPQGPASFGPHGGLPGNYEQDLPP